MRRKVRFILDRIILQVIYVPAEDLWSLIMRMNIKLQSAKVWKRYIHAVEVKTVKQKPTVPRV